MNQEKLSQSFRRLREAQTACEIVQYVTECAFYQDYDEDEPPIQTVELIQTLATPTPEPVNDVAITSTGQAYRVITTKGMIHGTVRVTGGIVIQSQEVIGDSASDWDPLPMLPFVDKRDLPTVMKCISRHIMRTAGEPSAEQIEWLHQVWLIALEDFPKLKYPLAPLVRALLQEAMKAKGTHPVKTATVDKAGSLTTTPYVISETIRRQWEAIGSVDTIAVDGEPIVTQISQLPCNHQVFKPKGTTGELMPMPTQRDRMETPIALVAYQQFGGELRNPRAADIAQLLTLAYAVNEPLQLSVRDGASLLARGEDGQLRRPRASDEQRFENAFAAIYGLHQWITDERGINRFYPLTACDRLINDRVKIAAAGWARDRSGGRWTLTAGFGVAGQHRLAGNTHVNNIWRVIAGGEYWLARERFHVSGPNKRFSQALVPVTGKTGAGQWYTLTWQELMMIAGDVWDWNDKQTDTRAYKRFQRVRDALIAHGYQVKELNTPAEAGDTVEFLFQKRGRVKVRATARFVEAARKADRADWETVNLTDWLGWKE